MSALPEDREFVVSSVDESAVVLRERFQQYGYLYIKKYVSDDKCRSLLNDFLRVLDPYLEFDCNRDIPQLTGAPFVETDAIWDEVYPKMQSLEAFHQFFHESDIVDLMKIVSDDDVFVYPMKMARVSTPKKIGYETPPHQDGHSHNAGPTMAGFWVALHDVSTQMGRVKVLPGSHKGGIRPVLQSDGVGGIQCEIYPEETTWHVCDYQRGDVLIFHSAMVHKAEPNRSSKDVRISIDTRFCDYGAPVFSTNLEPHHGWRIDALDWDRVYRDWQDDKLKHYWLDYPNLF